MQLTRKGKVIRLENPNNPIGMRIEAAKKRAEENRVLKQDKSEAWNAESGDSFSLEEFDAMLLSNEFFNGKTVNFTRVEQFNKLHSLGKWMDAKCGYVRGISVDHPSRSRKNATVRIDLAIMNLLDGEAARVYAAMAALADDITISGIVQDRKDGDRCIRVSFCIYDVWDG